MTDGPKDCPPDQRRGALPGATQPLASTSGMVRDWITIWESELSAAATDREAQSAWSALVTLWADAARTATAFMPPWPVPPGAADASARRSPPESPSRPAATDAALDARDAALEQLVRRVAELERRLAGLDEPKQPG